MTSENEANVPFLYPLKTSKSQFFFIILGIMENDLWSEMG